MTALQARQFIVLFSLLTCTFFVAFMVLCPLFMAIKGSESFQIVQIIMPVFAGYLGSAVIFLFQPNAGRSRIKDPVLLRYLVIGPFGIFWFLGAVVFVYFWASNLPGGVPGMDIDQLSNYITLLISFMNATIGVLSAYLFGSETATAAPNPQPNQPGPP